MIELYAVCSYSVGLKGLVNIYILLKKTTSLGRLFKQG